MAAPSPGRSPFPFLPGEVNARTAFLVLDIESIPDGALIEAVKYPGEGLSPDQAIERAQAEARETSWNKSDFLPYTFQIPVAVCIVRVGADFQLQKITCLDAPQFRPRHIVSQFWSGMEQMSQAKLVTFNGRTFDLPMLEVAAYRMGISIPKHIQNTRHRYQGGLDLQEFMSNFGATRVAGGLDLFAKLIGKPGKFDVDGSQVHAMWNAGKYREINDYCLCDTLDTYFVFLRTRVMTGDLTLEREQAIVAEARSMLESKIDEFPVLRRYLDLWNDGPPAALP